MASAAPVVRLGDILDRQRFGTLHFRVLCLLALAMLIDGYCVFAVGMVAPALAKGIGVKEHALTGVFVIQQLGLLAGTFLVGPASDRFGRKKVMLICIAFAAVTFSAISLVHGLKSLTVLAFLSCCFFSSIIPNCVALAVEIAPRRLRSTMTMLLFCGYSAGSLIGAAVQAWLLTAYGWQGAFLLGGALCLVSLPLLIGFLPESIRFYATHDQRDPRISRLLKVLNPTLGFSGDERFVLGSEDPHRHRDRVPIRDLWKRDLLVVTTLLWFAYFFAFIVTHLLNSWNTTVMHTMADIPMTRIAVLLSARTIAGILGALTMGFAMDRWSTTKVIPILYLGSALTIAAISVVDLESTAGIALFAVLGFCSNSGLGGLNALAGNSYPSRIRATGVAWAAGIGRLGGMVGPTVGGAMLAAKLGVHAIYLTAALPETLAAIALGMLAWSGSGRRQAASELAHSDGESAVSAPDASLQMRV